MVEPHLWRIFMHSFDELAHYCTEYMLSSLEDTLGSVEAELQTSGETRLVKALQMIQLQKAISAIGVLSMFDAMLQDKLGCEDGFRRADKLLDEEGKADLKQRFLDLRMAI